MGYTYDNRPRTAAKDEDQDDPLESLISLIGDALTAADEVISPLERDAETDLDDARKHAQAVRDDFSTAESVEKLEDFFVNIREARKNVGLLEAALRKAKLDAKRNDDSAAVEAVEDAVDALKAVKRELSDIESEIKEVESGE
jgi:DNA repair ATPase RecN